jgi:parallel beta-helix repeat protein
MKPKLIGGTKHATAVLVGVVCIAVLLLTLGLPTAAARGTAAPTAPTLGHHTIVTRPTGFDDTANIQGAFNTCTGNGWTCTIELVKGTYHISQIAVTGFQGSFVGAGQGSTVIQGNPGLASPTADPFWSALPGPANPWPAMFTFVNGAFSISGMTIRDTNFYPTLGWNWPTVGTETALWSWVLVTGTQAYVSMDHVTGIGGPGDLTAPGSTDTFNNLNGMAFEGMLLPPGWSDPYADQIPLSGSFSLTSSTFLWSGSAVWTENVLDATVTICFNSFQTIGANGFWDISASQVLFCGNVVTNIASEIASGYYGFQSVYKTDLLPSTVTVVGNYFSENTGGAGVLFLDYGPGAGLPSTLSAVVTGNVIVANTTCGECYSNGALVGVLGYALVNFVASYNVVTGSPNAAGFGIAVNNYYGGANTGSAELVGNVVAGVNISISVFGANGVHVTGNVVKNSGAFGIVLWGGSSGNIVSRNVVTNSGLYDLYWDGTGTGDVWAHNTCSTSSPPGLC